MPKTTQTILIVDDEEYSANMLLHVLRMDGYNIIVAREVQVHNVMHVMAQHKIQLVLLDLVLSSKGDGSDDGVALLEAMKRQQPDVPVIVFSAYASDIMRELPAIRAHAYAFVEKGLNSVALRELIRKALAANGLKKREKKKTANLSEEMRRILLEQIEKYAPVKERTVHIEDEGAYELIKPLIGFKRDIEHQLSRFPFAGNVFLMMKFRDGNRDLGEYIIENLKKEGLRGVRADHDDWNVTGNVYNPIAVLYCCKYGIALFDEPEEQQAYSPNVAYELGMMHYQNKNCLIIKHSSLPKMPFDLIKDLYKTYAKDLEVRRLTSSWINQISHKGHVPTRASRATSD